MKRIIQWLFTTLIVGILSLAPLGCATAKRTTVATITTVHQAMLAWRDYVAAGHATEADETRVRAAYGHYQSAVKAAKTAFAEADAHPEREVNLSTAFQIVAASADDLVNLVTGFLKRKATL